MRVYKEVDFSGWNIDFDGIVAVPLETLNKVVQDSLDEELGISIPIMYGPVSDGLGGRPPKDPLSIDVCLPFESEGDSIAYRFSIADEFEGHFMDWAEGDESYAEGSLKFAKALHRFADKIEKAVAAAKAFPTIRGHDKKERQKKIKGLKKT